MTKREILDRLKDTLYRSTLGSTEHARIDLVLVRALLADLAADVRAEETPKPPELANPPIRTLADVRDRLEAIHGRLCATGGVNDGILMGLVESLSRDCGAAALTAINEMTAPVPTPVSAAPRVIVVLPPNYQAISL